MAGVDLRDCFFHLLVSPMGRRLLGVRSPASGRQLPSGLGPSSGRNGRRKNEFLRASKSARPSLRAVGVVRDLGLIEVSGDLTQLFV